MMCYLIQSACNAQPVMLLLHRLHMFDSLSWKVTMNLIQQVQPLIIVVSHPPFGTHAPPPAGYNELMKLNRVATIELKPLPVEACARLVARFLGINEVPQRVAELFKKRGRGNPFFIQEFIESMMDKKLLRVEDGKCILDE